MQSDAALIGGETAEHPGLMPEDEYDLAGFAVVVCDKKEMITGEELKAGDVLIGMASTGVHSNGSFQVPCYKYCTSSVHQYCLFQQEV